MSKLLRKKITRREENAESTEHVENVGADLPPDDEIVEEGAEEESEENQGDENLDD